MLRKIKLSGESKNSAAKPPRTVEIVDTVSPIPKNTPMTPAITVPIVYFILLSTALNFSHDTVNSSPLMLYRALIR